MSKAQNIWVGGWYFCVGGNILQLGNSKHRMSLGLVSPDGTYPEYCVQARAPGKHGLILLSVSSILLTIPAGSAGNVPSCDKELAGTARALFQPRDRMFSNALSQ